MGNYVAFKNYTQKEKNHFKHFTRSQFSLIVKSCVALGTPTLISSWNKRDGMCKYLLDLIEFNSDEPLERQLLLGE